MQFLSCKPDILRMYFLYKNVFIKLFIVTKYILLITEFFFNTAYLNTFSETAHHNIVSIGIPYNQHSVVAITLTGISYFGKPLNIPVDFNK